MKASHGPRACYTLLGRGQVRPFHPASVQIGEEKGAPRPLAQVKSTIGQAWVPYHQLVENRGDAKSVDAEVFREMLDKAGLSLNSFATESRRDFGHRSLYVALGNDLPSAVLLASAQNWVEVTRPGVVLKPLQVRLPIPGWFGVQNVVREFWKDRGLSVLDLYPKPADYEQVASVYPEPIDWETVGHKDPRVSLLVRWVLFRTVRLQERHPFGASILFGTNLDRNLQRIADALVPNDAPLGRNRRAGELWDLSMEPTTFQLPVVDTVHADWKTGLVTCHRPLLALTIAQLENTAGIFQLDRLAPLLSKPPPVHARLSQDQSRELLQLAKRCHVRTRAMRKVAQEFIQKSCRLDYKMGWSTLNARAVADLPEDALLLVIAALVGFSSNVAGEDWLKNPPDSIRELVPIVRQVSQKLPASPVCRIKGTNVALVYNTPYDPLLTADVDVFSFVALPDAFPEAIEMPEWASKSDSHPHPPTKCFTGTTYGRWLVQLFTTPERRQKNEDSGKTFWVTHLRDYDDPWWNQISNGARFTAYLRRETHDAALQDGSSPSRPAPLLLRDVPLVLSGTAGLAGPTEDGEDVPDGASHLQVVACPPFGFWAAQMRNHVWQGVSPVVNKAPGHIQRLHWLVEFLPKPGLLGPLFVPIDRQVSQHIRAVEHLASKTNNLKVEFNTNIDEEQYKRVKAAVVSTMLDGGATTRSIDSSFVGAHHGLTRKGTLKITSGEEGDEAQSELLGEEGAAYLVDDPWADAEQKIRAADKAAVPQEEEPAPRPRAPLPELSGWGRLAREEEDTTELPMAEDYSNQKTKQQERSKNIALKANVPWRIDAKREKEALDNPVYSIDS